MDKKIKVKKSSSANVRVSYKWAGVISLWAFVLSLIITFTSSVLSEAVTVLAAFFILFFFILLGVLFDIIGIAVATASETPFHTLASRKIKGAKESVWLIRNAQQVSSFCNDVIGDIAGIISGAMATTIILKIYSDGNIYSSVLLTALVASMTIGGKALGKGFSIKNNNAIVFFIGKVMDAFENTFKFIKKK